MRGRDDALASLLASLRQNRDARWRSVKWTIGYPADDAFALHANTVCADQWEPSGAARSAERIRQRVVEREGRCMQRTVLDLQRLADLQERVEVRSAQAARRQWFILGRLLAYAARDDARWGQVLEVLIAGGRLTRSEKRALGIDSTR